MDIHIGNGLYVKAAKFGFKPQYPGGFQGLLFKRGHNVKRWKARYFVLTGKSLKYFIDSNCKEKDLRGAYILDNNSSLSLPSGSIDGKKYLIDLKARRASDEADSLLLSASTDTDRQLWLHALQEAIHDGVVVTVQPDIWHTMFKIEIALHVQHGQDIVLNDGNQVFEPNQLSSAPTITFPRHGLRHDLISYCLVIVDVDTPSRDCPSRHSRIVWLQANIVASNAGREEILPFELKSGSTLLNGIHRVFYVLFEQSNHLALSSHQYQLLDREGLSIPELAQRLQLSRPIGIDGCYVDFGNDTAPQLSSPNRISHPECNSPIGPDTLDSLLEIPAEGLFRDVSSTSEASSKNNSVPRENRRVSFISSSSMTTGSPGTVNDGTPPLKVKGIVSALKGSSNSLKKRGRRKSVSFKLDEPPLYVASEASFPEAVALDLIANGYGDDNDPPDYDLGSSTNRVITYSSPPPSSVDNFTPPKIRHHHEQLSLELQKPSTTIDETGNRSSPQSSSTFSPQKTSSIGLESVRYENCPNNNKGENGKNVRGIGSLNTSMSAILGKGGSFVEQLATIAHDPQLVCEFFRVSNKNIFSGGKLVCFFIFTIMSIVGISLY